MPRVRVAVGLLLAAILCFKLAYLERWLTDNDNYITLSTFFSSEGHPDYVQTVRRFYAGMTASCQPPGDAACVAASSSVLAELTYQRPLNAYFGSWLATPEVLRSRDSFLTAISRVTVWQVMVSAAVVAMLAVVLVAALPSPIGSFIALMLAVYGIAGFWLPEQAVFGRFQLLLGLSAWGGVAVALVGLLLALIARSPGLILLERIAAVVPERRRTIRWLATAAAVLIGVRALLSLVPALRPAYAAFPVPGADVGVLALIVSLAGIPLVGAAVWQATLSRRPPAAVLWIALLLFVGFVSTGENFFATAFHIAARGHIYLLAAPLLVYAACRPNGRALWLLPALALFSVSIAGLFYGCMVATEMVAGIRRRRLSLALVLAIILFVIATVNVGSLADAPVTPVQSTSVAAIAAGLDVVTFLPAVAIFGLLAVAGYLAWRLPDPGGDLLLRAVVLAALLAGAGQLQHALIASGVSTLDPTAYNYVLMSYYLAPIVCAAGLFLTMIGFAAQPRRDVAGSTVVVDTRALAFMAVAVLALAAVRGADGVGRPANALVAIASGAAQVAAPRPPADLDPAVVEAASADDRYLVGPTPTRASTMMSILKMKVRSAAGLLRPENATIVVPARP